MLLAVLSLSEMRIETRSSRGLFLCGLSPERTLTIETTSSEGGGAMVKNSSDRVFQQVNRIFQLGAVGSVSDAQLVEWFIAQKDACAEAAFEELMIRHGPMVFGVCRSALHDSHDAEDAFQAVFLVLANRARFIRNRESIGSWLFGVAHRVASRARSRAARRRTLDRLAAERSTECDLPIERDPDCDVLHDEVNRLPERLRAPLVLCYLEGLTYASAAHRLALSDGTLRGRLSQARNKLRRRLTQRGVTIPAGLLAAGTASQSQAAVPAAVVQSTIRIALGLTACDTASTLARGVLRTMLLIQIKTVATLMLLTAVGCLIVGYSWAIGPMRANQPPNAEPDAVIPPIVRKENAKKTTHDPLEVRGVVVDETGRPVAGVEVRVDAYRNNEARGVTGADGSFAITLRSRGVEGRSLLARSANGDQVGFLYYDYKLTKAQAGAPARIVLKAGREVIVRVTDSNKAPVPDASVQAGGVVAIVGDARTGPDGLARLGVPVDAKVEWVIALKSKLGFDYAEFGPIDEYLRSQGGAPATELPASIALALDGARTVRIKAVDRDGRPLAAVEFSPWLLHKEARRSQVNLASAIFSSTTGPDGVAEFDWLPSNNEAITFWPNSEDYAHRRVELKEAENGPVTATLTRNGSIRGRVAMPDGLPAQGIEVRAMGSGQGSDSGQGRASTAADGSYEMAVNTCEGYAVYVDDEDWAALSRLDVVVRDSKPVDGVDFKLTPGTIIRGTVTLGRAGRPAANQFIRLDETGVPAPEDLRQKGDHFAREIRRQFGALTDSAGRYSIRVGPGTYTLMGPPRTGNEKIVVVGETELVRDFRMPRPEKGTLTGRVVRAGADDKGIGQAKVQIAAVNMMAIPFAVTADAEGRFQAERELDPLVVCATSPDGNFGAIVEVGAEDAEVTIPAAPTATATGLLLDEKGQAAARQELCWGRRIFLDDDKNVSMTCFAPKVVTDANGRFMLPALVVGQEYEISVQRDNVYNAAGTVRPETASPIDLGTLRAGAYQPKSLSNAKEMSSFRNNAPGAGAIAPPIEGTTLDGKPLKLDDFHGKYVLLDFWATWCGPCIAEIPQLQAIHEAFRGDERFAILSLSVDDKIDEPKRFQEKRKLPWTQAFLGGGIHGAMPGTFGIRAIPAFVLIGPDGKIVARGMRGDDIKKEVGRALAIKP